MNIPDIINGLFEMGGSIVVFLSILRLLKDKTVRGVSWVMVFFFASWGYWNLYYYSHLNQWMSWAAGLALVIMNTIYFLLLVKYIKLEKK